MDMATTSADYINRAKEHLAFSFLTEEVTSRYAIGALLGRGGFGAVFAGVRKADAREVAVKFFKKDSYFGMMTMPGETGVLPIEVGLMELVSKPFRSPYVLELLEWFEIPTFVVLILERPSPCVDLLGFCDFYNGKLPEALARDIMLQLVRAAYHCYNCGVFHNDIKPENVLINTVTMQIKLIDFGSGKLLNDEPYNFCTSTPVYSPPEYYTRKQYMGCHATIWFLGVVLFQMVCGDIPFKSSTEIIQGHLHFPPGISKDCRQLISWCLKQNPKSRPRFMQILRHRWFSAGKSRVQCSGEALCRGRRCSEAGGALMPSEKGGGKAMPSAEQEGKIKPSREKGDKVKPSRERGDEVKPYVERGDKVKPSGETGDTAKASEERGDTVKTSVKRGDTVKTSAGREDKVKTSAQPGSSRAATACI